MEIDNAIILAAGYSSRFVPLCFDFPKGLIPVFGETLIERQIRQLHEVGITDITVVTGAFADKFDFLKSKCNLVFNKDFHSKNNYASLFVAKNKLGNTAISSCDLYFPRNIFQKVIDHPYFFSVYAQGKTTQRTLQTDKSGRIIAVKYGGENCWITFGGHACFSKEVSQKIISLITPVYDDPKYANKYWVDFYDEHLSEITMYVKKGNKNDIVEFNSLDILRKFDPTFSAIKFSPTMRNICLQLKANENELSNFRPQKDRNRIIGCFLDFKNKTYFYNNESGDVIVLW